MEPSMMKSQILTQKFDEADRLVNWMIILLLVIVAVIFYGLGALGASRDAKLQEWAKMVDAAKQCSDRGGIYLHTATINEGKLMQDERCAFGPGHLQ